ncbi:MAG: transposase, partial [Syntrophorhabdus aromaticivorans]|nr:transposase [Syntrophorhabdus aromaticivorans]
MNEWHSAKELAGLPGIPGTERGVQIKAQQKSWQSRPRAGRGGGREYHISALPEATRIALLEREAGIAAPDEAALQEYLTSRRITLSPAELADPRVQAKLNVARAINLCPAYKGREKLIAALAAQHSVSSVTIRRWKDDVEKMYTKVTPRVKLGDEKIELPRSHAFTPQALAFGLSTYANNMRSGMRAAYRAMESQASSQNWKVGDYVSFTRLVGKIPEAIWIYIEKGATGFELACVPKIIRQWTAIPVQSVLCGDQKIFDYEVYDPVLERIIVPNGYLWMDCASRMITGCWVELGHYNSNTVCASAREAFRYGYPDEFFTDNGKPELSRQFTHMRHALSGVSVAGDYMAMAEKYGDMYDCLEVEHRKAPVKKPWTKPIENVMNIFDRLLAEEFLGGYRKRNNDAWVNEVNRQRLMRDRKIALAPASRQASRADARGLMVAEQFIQIVYSAVEKHNKNQKQLKEGGAIVPFDFFRDGWLREKRYVLDDKLLDYLCMPCVEVTPRQGTVHFKARSNDYRGYSAPALITTREKVRVSYNPYDRDAVAVITDIKSCKLIGDGIAEPNHAHNPYDQPGLAAKMKRKAELMKWASKQAKRLKEGFD